MVIFGIIIFEKVKKSDTEIEFRKNVILKTNQFEKTDADKLDAADIDFFIQNCNFREKRYVCFGYIWHICYFSNFSMRYIVITDNDSYDHNFETVENYDLVKNLSKEKSDIITNFYEFIHLFVNVFRKIW